LRRASFTGTKFGDGGKKLESESEGGQKGRGLGGSLPAGRQGIFARPRLPVRSRKAKEGFSAAAEFRISLCEMRRQESLFTFFNFWCSIKVVES